MRSIVFILMLLCLFACSKEVVLDQPAYESKIVVDGWIETNGYAHIFLTKSSPFLTHYDSASIRNTFLNYAKITLTSSTGESEILTLFKEDHFFPPFVYRSTSMKGKSGQTYDIKIEVMSHTVTASTTIPQPIVSDRVWMEMQTDTTGYLYVHSYANATDTTYLFTQIKGSKADNNFHPPYTPMYLSKPSVNAFSICLLRSRETNLYLTNPGKDVYQGWPKFQYALDDTVLIKVGSIDKQSYIVLQSIFGDQTSKENPFAFNGSSIQTNITGGIGRWTGIGITSILTFNGKKLPE